MRNLQMPYFSKGNHPAHMTPQRNLHFSNSFERYEKICFYIALVSYIIWKVMQTSMFALPEGSRLNTLIHFGALGFFVLSCIRHIKFDVNFCLALLMGVLGILVKISADSILFVDLAVIFYAGHRYDFKDIAKASLAVIGLACLLIVLCSQVGFIEDYIFVRKSDGTVRHGLGFLYCTYLSHYYLNLVLLYVYLRPQVKVPKIAVMLAIDVAIYLATDSRNSFLMVILVLLFVAVRPKLNKYANARAVSFARVFIGWSFVIFTAICFALPLLYNAESDLWRKVNLISSNRLAQTQAALGDYGIKPLGQDIELYGFGLSVDENGAYSGRELNPDVDTNYVDSSFVSIPIHNGAIAFILVLTIVTLGSIRLARECESILLMIILITVLHASIDDLFLKLQYSSFLFLFWDYAVFEIQDGRLWREFCVRLAFLSDETMKEI